jgi:hypothetical protein
MLLRPPRGGRPWDFDDGSPYVLECRPNLYTTSELTRLARAAQLLAGAAAQGSAGGGHAWTWRSSVRLIKLWSMQRGESLHQWLAGAKEPNGHGISEERLEGAADALDPILVGSTGRDDLDRRSITHANKWAPLVELFADSVRRAARLAAHRAIRGPPRVCGPTLNLDDPRRH